MGSVIKNILKKTIPLELNFRLRNIIKLMKTKQPEFSEEISETNNIYFLDAPEYSNIGDQAIAYAMRKFMTYLYPDTLQFEICENEFAEYFQWLKKNIKSKDIICLNGGGNMGVLYPKYEAIRRQIIKNFPNNRIVIFPQTIDYGDTFYGKRELNRAKKVYGAHANLILSAREENSHQQMLSYFPNNKVVLCPDIVCFLDYSNFSNSKEKSRVGICLRDDYEGVFNKEEKEIILDQFEDIDLLSTTPNYNGMINNFNRKDVVEKKLLEFSQYSLIITDRLHGMIFSHIVNTSCIALPNSNGKVEGVSKWLEPLGTVRFTNQIYDLNKITFSSNKESIINEFDDLINLIKL